MSSENKKYKENKTEQLLFEILAYVRANTIAKSTGRAQAVLTSYKKALTYQNTDGEKNQMEVSKIVNISQPAVSQFQKEFVQKSLATPPSKYCPNYKALFTLEELGISLKKLKKGEKSKQKSKEVDKNE